MEILDGYVCWLQKHPTSMHKNKCLKMSNFDTKSFSLNCKQVHSVELEGQEPILAFKGCPRARPGEKPRFLLVSQSELAILEIQGVNTDGKIQIAEVASKEYSSKLENVLTVSIH